MKIGVPKEIKNHEYRVGLTPGSVREYIAHGHDVVVDTNCGAGITATDDEYRAAGAVVLDTAEEDNILTVVLQIRATTNMNSLTELLQLTEQHTPHLEFDQSLMRTRENQRQGRIPQIELNTQIIPYGVLREQEKSE